MPIETKVMSGESRRLSSQRKNSSKYCENQTTSTCGTFQRSACGLKRPLNNYISSSVEANETCFPPQKVSKVHCFTEVDTLTAAKCPKKQRLSERKKRKQITPEQKKLSVSLPIKYEKDPALKSEVSLNQSLAYPLTPCTGEEAGEDDDDESDLPKFDTISDEKIAVWDVVWVKWRKDPYWPALVLELNLKKKKITVGFLEYVNDKLKHKPLPMVYKKDRIQPITTDYSTHVENGNCSRESEAFQDAIFRVEKFLLNRGQTGITAKEYFAKDFHEFNMKRLMRSDSFVDSDSVSSKISDSSYVDSSTYNDGNNFDCSDVADLKEGCSDEEDHADVTDRLADTSFDTGAALSEDTQKSIEQRRKTEAALVDLIRNSSELKEHLKNIYFEKQPSQYHSNFKKPKKTKSESFAIKTQGFGPIEKESHITDLKQFLQNYLCEIRQRPKQRNDIYYLTDVWMPEAIILGMQSLHKVTRAEAERLFSLGVQYTQEEIMLSANELIASTTEEDRKEQKDRTRRKLSIQVSTSPVSKLLSTE